MATDNTPIPNKTIIVVGAGTLLTLVGLKFVLDSYFAQMTDEAVRSKLAPTTELDQHRDAEKKRLAGGVMPIEKAMADLAAKGRDNPESLGADLAPRQSDDLGPMTGWVLLPQAAPRAAAPDHAPAAGDAGAAATAGDAGRAAAGDAGPAAPHAPAAGDAAAPAPKPPPPPPGAPPAPAPHGEHH
jgi:hypothetical protein